MIAVPPDRRYVFPADPATAHVDRDLGEHRASSI
jgi:hypothetical protein